MRVFASRVFFSAVFVSFLLSACATPADDKTVSLRATLMSSAEVPPNASTGTGTLQAQLNKESKVLSWTLTYSGLTGAPKAGHFHGPAPIGQNAGVVLPFKGSLDSPISGSATLTDAQVTDLLDGKWYVNLHTAANPGGEVRGQVQVTP